MTALVEDLHALGEVMKDCGWHARATVCLEAAERLGALERKEQDVRWLVQMALADIASEAITEMSNTALNSTILAQGDDPKLVAERTRAVIQAALKSAHTQRGCV